MNAYREQIHSVLEAYRDGRIDRDAAIEQLNRTYELQAQAATVAIESEHGWMTAQLIESAPATDPDDHDDDDPLYAILPGDDEEGYVVGEMVQVVSLRNELNRLILYGTPTLRVDNLDERLGWRWMCVADVVSEYGIPASTVRRWMPRIPGAEVRANRWYAPAARVRSRVTRWLERHPG